MSPSRSSGRSRGTARQRSRWARRRPRSSKTRAGTWLRSRTATDASAPGEQRSPRCPSHERMTYEGSRDGSCALSPTDRAAESPVEGSRRHGGPFARTWVIPRGPWTAKCLHLSGSWLASSYLPRLHPAPSLARGQQGARSGLLPLPDREGGAGGVARGAVGAAQTQQLGRDCCNSIKPRVCAADAQARRWHSSSGTGWQTEPGSDQRDHAADEQP